jgi:selT/selW/selH-like putative selenoprotein
VSLKEAIESQLKIPTSIKMGSPGSFDVSFDGARIFSKKQTGRMPQQGEIIQLLQAKA